MNLEKIKEKILPYLANKDMYLYDMSIIKEFDNRILQILVDYHHGGITVDDLAMVNEYISSIMDEFDQDESEYMLEVSSPGAEKELRNLVEVENAVGEYIHIEFDGLTYEGYLESLDGFTLIIKYNQKGQFKKLKIDYDKIQKIRLAVKI